MKIELFHVTGIYWDFSIIPFLIFDNYPLFPIFAQLIKLQ